MHCVVCISLLPEFAVAKFRISSLFSCCVCVLYLFFFMLFWWTMTQSFHPLQLYSPKRLCTSRWQILLKDLGSRGELDLEEANSLKGNFRHLDSWKTLNHFNHRRIFSGCLNNLVFVSSQTQKPCLHLHYQTCLLVSTHKQMVKTTVITDCLLCANQPFSQSDTYGFCTLCLAHSGH